MYITSYSESSGQPYNGHQEHGSLEAALTAWARLATGSLIHQSGGRARLVEIWDRGEDELLVWIEGAEGGYVSGRLAEDEEIETMMPAQIAEWLA